MISQLTVYAKILCLLMTLFSAGASTRNDIYLQSACNLKFLRAENGAVFADDNWQNGPPQNFTLEASTKQWSRDGQYRVAITIYSKATNTYICFDKNWRTKAMVRAKANMPKRCLFYESIVSGGAFRYQSVANQTRFLGFQKNGKPIGGIRGAKAGGGGGGSKGVGGRGGRGRRRPIDEKCYNFQRSNASASPLQNQYLQQQQQQHQQQPKQRQKNLRNPPQLQQNRPQQQQQRLPDSRKDSPGLESVAPSGSGNSLLEGSYSANGGAPAGQSLPHPHRHKHGVATRKGKSHRLAAQASGGMTTGGAVAHSNLDSGAAATTAPSAPGGTGLNLADDGPYGKVGSHHRRSHLNAHSPASDDGPMGRAPAGRPGLSLPSSSSLSSSSSLILTAITSKLPPKPPQPVHRDPAGPDEGGGSGSGSAVASARRERPHQSFFNAVPPTAITNSHETSGGSVGGAGGAGATGKKKATGGNGRHATKAHTSQRGADKRSQG